MAKILVVDDNLIYKKLTAAALRVDGYEIKEASSAEEALNVVKNFLPDLIVTDVLMPGIDGFEFVKRLKSQKEFRHIKIIFYTGTFSEAEEAVLSKEMGVIDHLIKPLGALQIQQAVKNALNMSPPPLESETPKSNFEQTHLSLITNKLVKKIEELEKTNEELQTATEFFKSLANSIPQLAWEASADGTLNYVNERWRQFHDFTLSSVNLKQWAEWFHPEDGHGFVEKTIYAFENFANFQYEARLLHAKTQRYIPHLISAVAIPSQSGQITRWFGTCTDISDQKNYEENLIKLKEEAENLSHAKSEFLNNISHELRTPLSAILGFCGVLNSLVENNEHKSFLSRIHNGASRLNSILDDVISISEIEANTYSSTLEAFDLSQFVNEIANQYLEIFQSKGLDFVVLAEFDKNKKLVSHPKVIRQILSHLLENSIKFTPNGRVELKVHLENENEDGRGKLIFAIKDTGIGIKPEVQPHLFQPFTQQDSSSTRKYGGLGLGLLLSRKLAQLIEADVRLIYSLPNEGSLFQLNCAIRKIN